MTADYPSRLLKTTNGGINWYNQNTGVTDGLLCVQFLNDTVGYITGNSGTILKTTTGGEPIGIKKIESEIPIDFILYQNYPNPFNPVTTIKFDLPGDGLVSFKIYDILGKELYSVNEFKQAGTYTITLDGSNYASGLYFYRLESGSYVETKKMVLVK